MTVYAITPERSLFLLMRKIRRDSVTGCWNWTGHCNPDNGYPRVTRNKRSYYAYRVGYELMVGPIPSGLQIDHLCRNPKCINPDHLEPVTALVNVRRSFGNNSKRSCPRGHEYDADNTRLHKGRRYCITCVNARNAARPLKTSTTASRPAGTLGGSPAGP